MDLSPQQDDGCGLTVVKTECLRCARPRGCVPGESARSRELGSALAAGAQTSVGSGSHQHFVNQLLVS